MKRMVKSDLILKLVDGDISADEFQQLQELMRTDPEVKELYYEHLQLEHSLDDLYGEQALLGGGSRFRSESKSVFARRLKRVALVAAACVVIGFVVAQLIPVKPGPAMASLRFSENSAWSVSGGELEDSTLTTGRVLAVESGAVELLLPRGVKAIVEGPARLELESETSLLLHQGRGSFVVPEEGQGFVVTTPSMKVVDLGTKFGVVSGWGADDQVHVIQGEVSVDSGTLEGRSFFAGDAIAVDKDGAILPVVCAEKLFQRSLPNRVEVMVTDDFEKDKTTDGRVLELKAPEGWKRLVVSEGAAFGSFNPAGEGRFYMNAAMNDTAGTGGEATGMRGPNVAFFFGDSEISLERRVGSIEEESVYTATFYLGVRDVDVPNAGYQISLVSGDTVLKVISAEEVDGDSNRFHAVSVSWDSSELPDQVSVGDPLSVQISPYPHEVKAERYLDFDNFKMTTTRRN